jgi:two-component system alkaline phosphatase synthesis response regulator PhoP/two-component system response regulator VicR
VFRGYQEGVDMYLTKPFNPQELLAFVRRIFRARETGEDGESRYQL